jgi:glyoxylase-like metal-dependent hydrolase (beta-lactamase superfamily II)
VPTFPNARYLFGRKEKEGWEEFRAHGDHDIRHLVDSIDPIVAAGLADIVEADIQVTPEIRLEPSHGHTPGHYHVRISSNGEEGVITGDLMHHPIQCKMPHRTARFDLDKEAGRATRIGFVERYTDSNVLVIGSHFADPSAGYITGKGDACKFTGVPAEASA